MAETSGEGTKGKADMGHIARHLFALLSAMFQFQEDFEIFEVFGTPCGFFHLDQIIQADNPTLALARDPHPVHLAPA
jgi:hypothetical protein